MSHTSNCLPCQNRTIMVNLYTPAKKIDGQIIFFFFHDDRRRFDFHSPARIDRGMELFIAIHRDLAQNKVWEPPRLFFDSSVSRQTVQQLTEIVKRHQVH